jgi:hypothetical protein
VVSIGPVVDRNHRGGARRREYGSRRVAGLGRGALATPTREAAGQAAWPTPTEDFPMLAKLNAALKGWRTIIVGLVVATAQAALFLSGMIAIAMRCVTTTPIGKGP